MPKIALEIKNKLRTTLTRLYQTNKKTTLLLSISGEDTGMFDLSGPVTQVWHQAIEELDKRNSIENIVDTALEDYPEDDSLKEIKFAINDSISVEKLNSEINKILTVLPEIGLSDSFPYITNILEKSDTFLKDILTKIKLDYDNSLAQFDLVKISKTKKNANKKIARFLIQIQSSINTIGDTGVLNIDQAKPKSIHIPQAKTKAASADLTWLSKSLLASKSVGLIKGKNGSSSGIILKGGFLLCPNFMIETKSIAEEVDLILGYDNESKVNQQIFKLDPSIFYSSDLKPMNKSKYYTLVKIKDPKSDLPNWGYMDIEYGSPPLESDPINIIHHPLGGNKSFGLPSKIIGIQGREIIYDLETKPGSSGGALLNQEFKLIGMHVRKFTFDKSTPISHSRLKAGIKIIDILKDLKTKIPKSEWDSFPFLQ